MARSFVPEDLYRLRQVSEVDLHPDGALAAFVVSWCDQATDTNRSQIWLVSPDGDGRHRQLTRGHADRSPRFSPDGRHLAFLSASPRQPAQLHVLPMGAGEPWVLGPFEDGCEQPVWLPDSSGLVVVAPLRPPEQRGLSAEELTERPQPRRITTTRYRYNGRGWIHDRVRQLFVVALDGGAPVALTDGPWDADQPSVSPDGHTVVFTSAREDDQEWSGGSDLWMVDVPGGLRGDSTSIRPTASESTSIRPTGSESTSIRRVTDGRGTWMFGRFVGDGTRLLAVGHETRGDAGLSVPWILPVAGGPPRRLGDGEIGVHNPVGGAPAVALLDDAVVLPGIHRGRVRIDRYPFDGSPPTTVADEPPVASAFAVDRAGRRLLHVASGPTRPAELFETTIDGPGPGPGPRPLTGLNDELCGEVTFADYEEIDVAAPDGHPVHGFVVRPPSTDAPSPADTSAGASSPGDTSAGPSPIDPPAAAPSSAAEGRRAGLLYVHGGPLGQYGLGFFDEFQAAAATGHVLVAGNPRGSDGYGQAHARAITGGGLGGRDWDDVGALADHLAALDEVDEGRLGIGGGSYGGFMTTWAIGHTDRFAAALSERAVNNWETLEGTSDIGAFFTSVYTGATNLSDIEAQRRQSPMSYVGRIRTPTLILHAEEDWRCPTEQAEQLFVALRRQGVPCELVRFPGENHEMSRSGRPSLRVARLRIVHDWWSRWLGSATFGPPGSGPPDCGPPTSGDGRGQDVGSV